jgi:hypothetical protein
MARAQQPVIGTGHQRQPRTGGGGQGVQVHGAATGWPPQKNVAASVRLHAQVEHGGHNGVSYPTPAAADLDPARPGARTGSR